MIKPENIRLYPMTQDVMGKRTHEEYVNVMANKIGELYYDYRMEFEDIHKLVEYVEQNVRAANAR